jgi:hypothetical protein
LCQSRDWQRRPERHGHLRDASPQLNDVPDTPTLSKVNAQHLFGSRAGLVEHPQPQDARGRLVLALGEVTGHAHAVVGPGTLVREAGPFGASYLHLPGGGRVVHEEHATIRLPKGRYRVVRQREYVPGAVRVVAD